MEQVKNDIQDTTLTNELFFLNCLFIIETFVLLQKHPFPSMFTIECGYYVSCSKHSYFHTNIGDDFFALIQARFMNNNLQEYTKNETKRVYVHLLFTKKCIGITKHLSIYTVVFFILDRTIIHTNIYSKKVIFILRVCMIS